MQLNLENKKVIVTGASRGIGLSIAESFLQEGAKVALVARNLDKLEEVSKTLQDKFGDEMVLVCKADVTKTKEVQEFVTQVIAHWGNIDIVVANVGDGRSVSEAMPSEDRFSVTWNTNFTSAETISRETLPHLEKSGGSLLFISSITGIEALGAPTDYSVAKSAIIALSKNLARKLAPKVRVNCIAPGNVYFEGGSWDEKRKADSNRVDAFINATVPMKRFGKPEEIADSVLFLCSERASFITGACLIVDGGQTVSLR